MEKKHYIAPEVEVLEIKIEQGFAQSNGEGIFNVPNGENNGDPAWM